MAVLEDLNNAAQANGNSTAVAACKVSTPMLYGMRQTAAWRMRNSVSNKIPCLLCAEDITLLSCSGLNRARHNHGPFIAAFRYMQHTL